MEHASKQTNGADGAITGIDQQDSCGRRRQRLAVRLAITRGETHDNRLAGKLLSRLKSGSMLLADRGHDADWIRELALRRGAWANIPPKRNRSSPINFSAYLYRDRNRIERFFNRIKQCRRVATRYDKLAANDLAFIQLASIRLWLRSYESTPWQLYGSSAVMNLIPAMDSPRNWQEFQIHRARTSRRPDREPGLSHPLAHARTGRHA
jgi:transposase